MAPPSQIEIATSSVLRLVKEESSYRKELQGQLSRIEKLERDGGDENFDFQLKQERQGVEETKAIFPSLREKIKLAVEKLEQQLEVQKQSGKESDVQDITKAKEAIASAKTSYREIA
ncbi:hypothetical protein MMC20_007162 [Loxospora ochrophaea]|nr:hypothetical protein [Loxospora ochrophaea]